MEKNLLYMMINRACNCACEICYTESHPACTERLDFELVKKFLQGSAGNKELNQIVFTGGEPFFYYEDLKKYIALAGNLGKRAACITNGFWAKDFEKACEKLIELKKIGLKEIILSYDYYHSKYILPETINNALKAAKEANIEIYLHVINARNHPIREWMDKIEDIHIITDTLFRPCLPEGNAKKNLSKEDYIRSITPDFKICQSKNKMLLKYDGTILPCIYPGMFKGAVKAGNYRQLNYQQAKEVIEKDVLVQAIRNYGFDVLLDYARKELAIEIPDKIVSGCELCGILFTRENVDKFYKHLNKVSHELIVNFL